MRWVLMVSWWPWPDLTSRLINGDWVCREVGQCAVRRDGLGWRRFRAILMSEVGGSDSAFAGAGSKVPAMGTVKSIAAARKAVREASAEAQQEGARRERDNIEDLATFLVARDRLAAVDDWEAEKGGRDRCGDMPDSRARGDGRGSRNWPALLKA